MKALPKKFILATAIIALFGQIAFLLILVNNLPVHGQVNNPITITARISGVSTGSTISGPQDIYAEVSGITSVLSALTFYFKDYSTGDWLKNSSNYYDYSTTGASRNGDTNRWTAAFSTTSFPFISGNRYGLVAAIDYNGILYYSQPFDFHVSNSGTIYPTPTPSITAPTPTVATPTPTPIVTTSTPAPPTLIITASIEGVSAGSTSSVLSGIKNINVTANYGMPDATYHIYNVSNSADMLDYAPNAIHVTTSNTEGSAWSGNIDTTKLTNGTTYKFYARSLYNGVEYSNYPVLFKVNNITTATPTPTPTVTTAQPSITAEIVGVVSNTTINGIKTVNINSNFYISPVTLYIYNNSNSADTLNYGSTLFHIIAISSNDGKYWTGTIDTTKLTNGMNYKFYVTDPNKTVRSNEVLFNVNNTAPIPTATPSSFLSPTPTQTLMPTVAPSTSYLKITLVPVTSPLSGTVNINMQTNKYVNYIDLWIYSIKDDGSLDVANAKMFRVYNSGQNQFTFNWNTKDFLNGNYKLEAHSVSGNETAKADYSSLKIANSTSSTTPQTPTPTSIASPTTAYTSSPKPTATITPTSSPATTSTPKPTSAATTPAPTSAIISPLPTINKESPAPSSSPVAYIPFTTPECKEKNVPDGESCSIYMNFPIECKKQNITDKIKCEEYMFKLVMPKECIDQGAKTQEECSKVLLLNNFPPICREKQITDEKECTNLVLTQSILSNECKMANITATQECDDYMFKNFMPDKCKEAKATTKEECDYIIRNSINILSSISNEANNNPSIVKNIEDIAPECKSLGINNKKECENRLKMLNAPEECKARNITAPEECEELMFEKYPPEICKNKGITNLEACKKYMYENANEIADKIIEKKSPSECSGAGAESTDKCRETIKEIYLPDECKRQGINTPEKCDKYLKNKYPLPEKCKAADIISKSECDKYMFEQFALPECKKAGDKGVEECENLMFNKYSAKVTCNGMEDLRCKSYLKENYLGDISNKQQQFEAIKNNSEKLVENTISVGDFNKIVPSYGNITPLTSNKANIKIIKAEDTLSIREDELLVQTSPVVIMIDNDKDGLSNDMEKLLGTDPNIKDSDGDGFSDGEEAKNGHNPIGEGLFTGELSGIEKAVLGNKILEHPKTNGETSDKLEVQKVENIEEKDPYKGYILTGKSEPNSVVTLYVYSDFPLVMTVKTDEYGNWEYDLSEPLSDGEHEVYVVINDEAGKVENKSKPFNFFVQEAKAVSVNDFVSQDESAKTPEQAIQKKFVLSTTLIIFAGLAVFILVIIIRRKKIT